MENVFSANEQAVLEILGRRKMSIAKLTEEYYEGPRPWRASDPIEPNNYIGAILRRIKRKCDHYKMTWTIEGKGAGSHGRTVWRAKRT